MPEEQNRSSQDKFMLRLPDGMRERLRAAAEKNQRSINSEIVHRLKQSLLVKIENLLDPFEKIRRLSEEILAFSEIAQENQNRLYRELDLQNTFSIGFYVQIIELTSEWLSLFPKTLSEDIEENFAIFQQWLERTGKTPRSLAIDPIALMQARIAFVNYLSNRDDAKYRKPEIKNSTG